MKLKEVNGLVFEKMLINGLNNLKNNEQQINNINIFPVPDGDTGFNMRLTLEAGLNNATNIEHLGDFLEKLSDGMLLGARGNSGVILSQLFFGFSQELKRDSIANVNELKEAFIEGYRQAYKAVVKPVEGTILTVARCGIENIKSQVSRRNTIGTFFSIYLAELKKTLILTPELLPSLKEAGVVDSGGLGYIILIEGMMNYLYGEEINVGDGSFELEKIEEINTSSFNENSLFELGYCTEFVLQLLNSKINVSEFDEKSFVSDLTTLGDSLVVVKNKTIVKVHIHTKTPNVVIEYALRFGEFVKFKLENMQLQHNENFVDKQIAEHKVLAKIAVANGEGIKEVYKELGCDIIIDGNRTMNTSSQELVNAIKACNADKIVILPNDKNIYLACEQAINVSKKDNVEIIKTSNILEGYYALAMDVADSSNIKYRIDSMKEGIEKIKTISIFSSTRDCKINNVKIKTGERVSISGGIVLSSYKHIDDCILKALESITDLSEKSYCLILKGEGFKDYYEGLLLDKINELYPDLEIAFLEGGQPVYDAIIGLL